MEKLLRFFKEWTLPIAMTTGAAVYFLFHYVSALDPIQPAIWKFVDLFTPTLIFLQLFLTFCKVDIKALKPGPWHLRLLAFQLLSAGCVTAILLFVPMNEVYHTIFEGALVCLICPTATAAAVITDKLGGSASGITVYTLLSNIMAALFVPLVFPLVVPHEGLAFIQAFLLILSKVFPLLLCPFLLAQLLRIALPKVHGFFLKYTHTAFYLWAFALMIVSGQTIRSLHQSSAPSLVMWLVAGAALLSCVLQFAIGKKTGSQFGDRMTAGQALGQKNTILAIWMAYTYLTPLSSLAPGTYVLWQNLFNSYQLWKKGRSSKSSNV
ncbi:MAG: transporter [Bacteroidales bacterium]|nr:transporter [Bacteroidales bacterium]